MFATAIADAATTATSSSWSFHFDFAPILIGVAAVAAVVTLVRHFRAKKQA